MEEAQDIAKQKREATVPSDMATWYVTHMTPEAEALTRQAKVI